MKAKSLTICLLLLALLAASAACRFGGVDTPPSANPPAATRVEAVENTPAAAAGQPSRDDATTAAEKPSGGPGDFRLEDYSIGLAGLASYRQSLVLTFDGMVNGTETHSKTSMRRTVMRQPAAQLTWLEIDGNPQQMVATLGEVSYQQVGADGACSASPKEPGLAGSPEAFQLHSLPAVTGASAAGEENVNDVPSTRYSFDESAIGRAGELKAKGDLWVAKEGGYVAKYSLSIVGENDQLGPGVSGTQTWVYELTAPNAVIELDLPASCAAEQAEEIAPLPPDAKDILRMPSFLQFNAALTPEQAAQFYKDQASDRKWEEIPAEPMKDADLILNFKVGDGGLVSIRLHKQEGGTRVTIQVLQGK